MNTSPSWQIIGWGTPQEHWQKWGLQSSGPGKRPSEAQGWSLQPVSSGVVGCGVVILAGVVVAAEGVNISVGVVVSGVLVVEVEVEVETTGVVVVSVV